MALKIFLKLGDIKGESTDRQHRDEIDVDSWGWGMTQQVFHEGGGGASAGRAHFQDIHYVHRIDKASPSIMLACASGRHLPEAKFSVRKTGKPALEYLLVKLTDVLVTSVQPAVNGDGEGTREIVTLSFAKVDFEYIPQSPSGGPGAGIHFKWNLETNQPG